MPRLEAADALEAVESGRTGLNVKRGAGGSWLEAAAWPAAAAAGAPEAVAIANSEGGTGAWGNGGVVEDDEARPALASETVALLWHFFDVMCDE